MKIGSHYALLAALFGIGLELVFAFPQQIFIFIPVLLALIIIGMLLLRWEEARAWQPIQLILPAIAALGLTSLSLFIPTGGLMLHGYFLACTFILYFLLRQGAKQAYPTWNWIISLIVLLVTLTSLLSWHWYIALPNVAVLAGTFLITSLIAFQSLARLPYAKLADKEPLVISLSLGLVLTQLAWALQFLPAQPILQAATILAGYYVLFHLLTISFERRVAASDFIEYGAIATAAMVGVFIFIRWI